MKTSITDAGSQCLPLAGEWTLERAAELKAAFLEALAAGTPLTLDLHETGELDFACIQMIAAARRTFALHAIDFQIRDSAEGIWKSAAERAGLGEAGVHR